MLPWPKKLDAYASLLASMPVLGSVLESALTFATDKPLVGSPGTGLPPPTPYFPYGILQANADLLFQAVSEIEQSLWDATKGATVDLRLYVVDSSFDILPLTLDVAKSRRALYCSIAAGLRKIGWSKYDTHTAYLTFPDIRLIWIRRLAYLLFAQRHALFAWDLGSWDKVTLRKIIRLTFGSCGIDNGKFIAIGNTYFSYGNAGFSHDNVTGPDNLTSLFYKYDPSFKEYPKPPIDLTFASAHTALDTGLSLRSKAVPQIYLSAPVPDLCPADYLEFVGNVVGLFPDAFSQDPRHALGACIDFFRARGYKHSGSDLAPSTFSAVADAATAANLTGEIGKNVKQPWYVDAAPYANNKYKDKFDSAVVSAWVNWMFKQAAAKPQSCGMGNGEGYTFRYMWVANRSGCQFMGPTLVAIGRALCACVTMFETRDAAPVKGLHMGNLFHGEGLECGLIHSDDVIGCGMLSTIPALGLVRAKYAFAPKSVIVAKRAGDLFQSDPQIQMPWLGSLLTETSYGLARAIADSIAYFQSPTIAALRPSQQNYFYNRLNKLRVVASTKTSPGVAPNIIMQALSNVGMTWDDPALRETALKALAVAAQQVPSVYFNLTSLTGAVQKACGLYSGTVDRQVVSPLSGTKLYPNDKFNTISGLVEAFQASSKFASQNRDDAAHRGA